MRYLARQDGPPILPVMRYLIFVKRSGSANRMLDPVRVVVAVSNYGAARYSRLAAISLVDMPLDSAA